MCLSRSASRRAEGDQVVVVEGDAVRAEVGQPVHGLDRVERGAGGVAERVAAEPADRPQAEGELVSRVGSRVMGACLPGFVHCLNKR